jgi:hypothetical protein
MKIKKILCLGTAVLSFACIPLNGEMVNGQVVNKAIIGSSSKDIFVSPVGDDLNDGTLQKPFKSIQKAADMLQPGATIYLRGGTYKYTSTINLVSSGTKELPLNIYAYSGEKPILDFSDMTYSNQIERGEKRGIFLTGNYWNIKGLEVCNAADNGMKIEGSNNIVEKCVFHNNKDSGLQIGLAKSSENPNGTLVSNNKIINCDSYRNFDQYTKGGNADGFACKLSPGVSNSFYGCRSWENSDDGWDFYHTTYGITIDNCWTWHNGDAAVFNYTGTWRGNGQGFKLGDGNANHVIKNSIAFDHKYTNGNNKGFDQNSNEGPVTVLNCVGWDNEINYYFGSGNAKNILKNNIGISYLIKNVSIVTESEQANNSWNIPSLNITKSDFITTLSEVAKQERNSDGSLPNNGLGRLKQTSSAYGKGLGIEP